MNNFEYLMFGIISIAFLVEYFILKRKNEDLAKEQLDTLISNSIQIAKNTVIKVGNSLSSSTKKNEEAFKEAYIVAKEELVKVYEDACRKYLEGKLSGVNFTNKYWDGVLELVGDKELESFVTEEKFPNIYKFINKNNE